MHPTITLIMKEELYKLLDVRFIQHIICPKRVSNMVPIVKSKGEICICTSFWNINKAYHKDKFPLPNINTLVNSTIGHEMLSFILQMTNIRHHFFFIWVKS